MIAGVDWFEGSWLTVVEDAAGTIRVERAPAFADLLGRPDLETLVIDVPIGLPDRGARVCDLQARKAIRPRGSSVFPAPIRPVLGARSQAEASQIRYAIEGKRCSAQAYAIYPIVADVDRQMSPEVQRRIREGHPELSFAGMNGGAGLQWPKRSDEGRRERIHHLAPYFETLSAHVDSIEPRRAVIDLLDAFAMLWTARRVRSGRAVSLPGLPEYDARGLCMEIVA